MDTQTFLEAITTVGFPIVLSFVLLYLFLTMSKQHQNEVDTLRTALEQNTIVLTKLCEKIDKE